MRAAAPIAGGRRSGKAAGRLKALALTILGVGVGLAALYFGLLAAFVFSAIVILPGRRVAAGGGRRRRPRHAPRNGPEDGQAARRGPRRRDRRRPREEGRSRARPGGGPRRRAAPDRVPCAAGCRTARRAAGPGARAGPRLVPAAWPPGRPGRAARPGRPDPTAVGMARRGAVAVRGCGRPDWRRAAGGAARARDPRRGLPSGAVRPVRGTGRRHEYPTCGAGAGSGGAHGGGGGRGGRRLRPPERDRAAALGSRRGRPGRVGRAGGAGDGARRMARHPAGARRGRAGRAPAHGGRPVVERSVRPAHRPGGPDHARFGVAEPGRTARIGHVTLRSTRPGTAPNRPASWPRARRRFGRRPARP